MAPEKEFMQRDGEKSRPIYMKTILPKSTEFMIVLRIIIIGVFILLFMLMNFSSAGVLM